MTLPVAADRVKESAQVRGTGAVSLLGAAVGYQSFLSGVGDGNTCYYAIADNSGGPGPNWEVGLGTYTAATDTLARTSVLASSNGGAAVNFAAGTQDVFLTVPASQVKSPQVASLGVGAAPLKDAGLFVQNSAGPGAIIQAGSGSNTRCPLVFLQSSSGTAVTTAFNATGALYTNQFVVISGAFTATLNANGDLTTFTPNTSGTSTMLEVDSDVAGPSVVAALSSSAGTFHVAFLDHTFHYQATVEAGGEYRWAPGTSTSHGGEDTGIKRGAAGVVTLTQGATAGGASLASAATSPATLAANANNYSPGVGLFQRWAASTTVNVTGMVAGQDGETRVIWNVGSSTITLTNQDALSTAANRWLTTTGASLALAQNKCALAQYDATTAAWRVTLLP